MILLKRDPSSEVPNVPPPFPGIPDAIDGSAAVVAMETAASEAAGAYPITPSTQMGEGWAVAVAEGKRNVNGRRLLFFEPEGEHAAAAVTAGMSMTGLRSANFSSGQGIVYMHESLYPAVGKRLTYVLNVAARAITKHALNVHAGHDDYHAVDDTGFFQLFAKDVQESADLNLIAHRIAELSLNPGICAQDGFLTSHVIESCRLPEPELIRRFLGDPADLIESPTPAQRVVFGDRRRRIPELFSVDYPAMLGVVQNQDSYAQGIAAQRPFYFDHVAELTDRAFREFAELTGRAYSRASGYRIDDAEWVILGQGSLVANGEAVADYLRETRGLKVGVVNLRMFRPFPADLVTRLLSGKKGVVVLERTDQPLSVEAPLLREVRAAMMQAQENGRAIAAASPDARGAGFAIRIWGRAPAEAPATERAMPYPALPALQPNDIPDFYSGCFGLGSRDLQPGDLAAAVENMLPGGRGRRQFYLGIDFVREATRLPKLQIWQEQLLESYPALADLALPSAGDFDLLPEGSVSVRIHSVGGWGAITMGKNLTQTIFELLGLHVKANPKYGSEKKGQPTTFYASFAHDPIRLNCELKFVDVVLAPDPNVFRHSNPLAGLREGGAFVIQSDLAPDGLWATLPETARREIVAKRIKVYALDGFGIAGAEASDVELRYRMQGAAFMGAFFHVGPLMQRESLSEETLFVGIEAQLQKKFGKRGGSIVADNLRVIRRGFAELRVVESRELTEGNGAARPLPTMPATMDVPAARDGVGNPGRFWEQVCSLCKLGQDGIADPFAAMSVVPAATSAMRDMTDVRMEVPRFIPQNCTGCAQCWTQCPDSAIPGLVSDIDDLVETAARSAGAEQPLERLRPALKPLAKETRKRVAAKDFTTFADALSAAYQEVAPKLAPDADKRAAMDAEFARVRAVVADYPLAKTAPFFDVPERRQAGSGGLLSVIVNPEACKGCNLCVDVCPDGALVTVKQDDAEVRKLRRDWKLWQQLPDTPDRYVNVSDIENAIGVLPSLLLQKGTYRSMVGGDGACMGCGEKTAVHLVVATIEALMQRRAAELVARLVRLQTGLEERARVLLAADVDLYAGVGNADVTLHLAPEARDELARLTRAAAAIKDLRWRYEEGPGGRGRAALGMANSTGCSSVWASTYPYNPYPFPWVNHLFQDSPSVAIGVFEGHMRKMADNFAAVRRAEALLSGDYDPEKTENELADFDWRQFTDDELALCPPIISMGGDGAMLDIGFQNLSRLLASGKPIRVIVLDTQVYSNTGGQACTSGFTGQVSDMAAFGAAQRGKTEERKELALIALAHRGAFVHQSSQASASHLMGGVIRGLHSRRPAVFNIYTPCPVEHGLADDAAQRAARLALESRAFPYLTFDPDAGPSLTDCLDLGGNPSADDDWPTYTIEFIDDGGATQTMELPLTTADWAATEGRFRRHFKAIARDAWTDEQLPLHEWLTLGAEDREGKSPVIHVLGADKRLERWSVSPEMVRLTEERQRFWAELRELAGRRVAPAVRERIADELQAEFDVRRQALEVEHQRKVAELKATYPTLVARKLADGLLRAAEEGRTVRQFLDTVNAGLASAPPAPTSGSALTPTRNTTPDPVPSPAPASAPAATPAPMPGAPVAASAPSATVSVAAPAATTATTATTSAAIVSPPTPAPDDALSVEPYIESERCTSCNECTGVNKKMFAYNAEKQAYIKDPRAGTFAQLVTAAEKCPVGAIHPGTPLNPKEKDLDKWRKRALPFS